MLTSIANLFSQLFDKFEPSNPADKVLDYANCTDLIYPFFNFLEACYTEVLTTNNQGLIVHIEGLSLALLKIMAFSEENLIN